jgi:phosphoglycolate phosphatase-like HAD superfamily hydrolase
VTEYDAVVFDNDGVLVELTPMTVLRDAVRAAFADVGVENPDEDYVELAADHEDLDALAAVESEYGVALDEFWPARERRAIEYQRDLIGGEGKPPYEDLHRITELDASLGVVSNNQQATVERIVVEYGLEDAVETVYGRTPTVAGVRRRKPDTYYLDAALEDLGTRNALYVGDSESDVVVAQRADIDSVFLRRPHRADTRLSVDPTYEFESLAALVDGLGT